MVQDSRDNQIDDSGVQAVENAVLVSRPRPSRLVAKTLLDGQKRIAKTMTDAPIPVLDDGAKKIAKTMIDAPIPASDDGATKTAKTIGDAPIHSPEEVVPLRQVFVAKTRLDHELLSVTLRKYEGRKEQIAINEARERASLPVKEFHPVDSKKLARKCPWTWPGGDAAEKFLYCEKCKSAVYNFDEMELPEAGALIFTRENKKVPTLFKRDDGKFMTQDCPVQVKKRKNLVLMSAVVATLLLASLVMVVLSPPPVLNHEAASSSVDDNVRATDLSSKNKSNSNLQDSDSQETSDGTVSGIVSGSNHSKRKRPVFGPEDEKAYWE